MKGTMHAALGAGAGFITANSLQSDPSATMFLVTVGGIAGLLPDVDVDGKLSNKITFSYKLIRTVAQLIGFLMILYSFLEGSSSEKWIGIIIGAGMMIISSFLTQRRMLTVTGIGVLAGGLSLHESWLILLGIYIIVASFISHRSYTHTLIGMLFFAAIALRFEQSIGVEGTFAACMGAYASHLIADMKILPFNKRGVKYFLPISKKEF
ncbi:metal-dependent hydrolase [Mesobacillus subterraneus]|nr:metal-dependent hydrolase [Mesobacillus subterraneus]MCM3664945.1 metal-dependent hydrolase [Mesobacillus subterraneus]MCM3682033.1 metal-dependent hydrolase [Mesobacillus subterraneus]